MKKVKYYEQLNESVLTWIYHIAILMCVVGISCPILFIWLPFFFVLKVLITCILTIVILDFFKKLWKEVLFDGVIDKLKAREEYKKEKRNEEAKLFSKAFMKDDRVIEYSKGCLKKNGNYIDMLWSIHDVIDKYEDCDSETAQKILHTVLNNEWLVEQTQTMIQQVAEDEYNLKPKND